MKKVILTAFLAVVALVASAQAKTVPYKTDLANSVQIDSEWTLSNEGRGNMWINDLNNDNYPSETTGTFGGVAYQWEADNAADTWLISPAVSLQPGIEYVVGIWAKTKNMEEKFKITMASGATAADQKAGQILIDKTSGYQNTGDFEHITAKFTVETAGDYHFGLNCCSDANKYFLFVTGFSIGDGSAEPEPEKPVHELPYNASFADAATFIEWKSVVGTNAANSSQKWKHSSYLGFAEFSDSYAAEDCWFISPALNITEANKYVIKMDVETQGVFEIAIGTNPEDISTFTALSQYNTESTSVREKVEISTDIAAPGEYYVAFHAKAEKGTWFGYRIYGVEVKKDVPTPVLVTDLAGVVDDDVLTVDLQWTNPSMDSHGNALDAITKVELYRNNEVLATLTPEIGSVSTYKDQLTESQACAYKVLVYGTNGLNDKEPIVLDLGYVGQPMAVLPYDYNVTNNVTEADMALWTIVDANKDGNTWTYNPDSYYLEWKSERELGKDADDYLMTPYFDLTAGYYRVTYNVSASGNSFEVGYATDRRDVQNSFVKCSEVIESSAYDYDIIISIPQDGRYCFVWHHIGGCSASYYNYVELAEVLIKAQPLLPDVVTDLTVEPLENNALGVTLQWVNPTLDNAGNALQELSHAVIYRDGVEVGRTTETLTPGATTKYVDNTITESAEYTYSVEVHNANGCSETAAPAAIVFVGLGMEVPYSTTNFSDWSLIKTEDSPANWQLMYDGSIEAYTYTATPLNCYALSPYIALNEGVYKVTVTTKVWSAENPTGWNFVVGTDPNNLNTVKSYKSFTTTTESEQVDVFTIEVKSTQPAAEEVATVVPAGRSVIGVQATTTGDIYVLGFSIEKDTTTGIESAVVAGDGISFVDGMICFDGEVSSVAVVDRAGRVVYAAENGEAIDASELGSGVVIVNAVVNGQPCALKVVL